MYLLCVFVEAVALHASTKVREHLVNLWVLLLSFLNSLSQIVGLVFFLSVISLDGEVGFESSSGTTQFFSVLSGVLLMLYA